MPFDSTTPVVEKITTGETVLFLYVEKLLSNESRWIKGRKKRFGLFGNSYCAIGALEYCAKRYDVVDNDKKARRVLNKVARNRGFEDMATFNDHPDTTHLMILNAIREAQELSKVDP